jgi:hypothetical protein
MQLGQEGKNQCSPHVAPPDSQTMFGSPHWQAEAQVSFVSLSETR